MGQMFTIGHSTHAMDQFLATLAARQVQVVADVRTTPFSRFAPQFDRASMQRSLQRAGLTYVFLGRELGGRPDGDQYYDAAGHVLYSRLAEAPLFLEGIERLLHGMERYRICLLCSEEDPSVCHRALLIGRVLAWRGVTVEHIRSDGSTVPQDNVGPTAVGSTVGTQLSLLGGPEKSEWRSLHPVPGGMRTASTR